MSDGPHRSLNMTRDWKRVAERCDLHSYSGDEVSASLADALQKDCSREIPAGFFDIAWKVLTNPEPFLFVSASEQLEDLRRCAGFDLGRLVLEEAILIAERGGSGRECLTEALQNALQNRAARAARQMQEHYCRKSPQLRATRLRARIESGIARTAFDRIARKVLKLEKSTEKPLRKKQGLDDGVPF